MAWPAFAVMQLVLTTLGVGLVFWLRNRELRSRLTAQEQAAREAAALLEEAAERYEEISRAAKDKWVDERIEELGDDDPVELVQKLVLQNEKESIPDFADSLRRRIASDDHAADQYRDQWRRLRTEAYQGASDLIERFPHSHPVILQIYEAFSALDEEHGVELPPLPQPADPDPEADGPEVVEHLRAANELLHQQLQDTQRQLSEARSTGADAVEQEEDLKSLLQQFTRDSRDMMACIQELEQENQKLREQLGGPSTTEQSDRGDHAA